MKKISLVLAGLLMMFAVSCSAFDEEIDMSGFEKTHSLSIIWNNTIVANITQMSYSDKVFTSNYNAIESINGDYDATNQNFENLVEKIIEEMLVRAGLTSQVEISSVWTEDLPTISTIESNNKDGKAKVTFTPK